MARFNSPLTPPSSNARKAALKQFKTLFLKLFRRAQGFLEAQKLPYVANKACDALLGEADAAHHARCRRILQTRLELNPHQLHRFFHTSMGGDLLTRFERFFHLPSDRDESYTLKDIILQMAADPEGLSLLSFLRRFPEPIQLNIDHLLFTAKRVELLLKETDATIAAIHELAQAELTPDAEAQLAAQRDLRQPGPFAVKQWSLTVAAPQSGSLTPATEPRSLQAVCYQPQPWPPGSVPVVVQSHGLASNPEDLQLYAEHLASYGFFVVAPQHPGSDADQVRNMLAGEAPEVFRLTEFIDRPLDVTHVLNELEQRNASELEQRLNLKAVGLMGYSFGAYTAFALAGADLHFEKLEMACSPTNDDPNISLLLQCRALGLPRQLYNLKDNRIQAILSIDSVGSEVFGQAGIENVQIPVMLIAGSHDAAAPLAFEQIRMFHWLTTPHHYLALMRGRSHIRDMHRLVRTLDLHVKVVRPKAATPTVETPFEHYIKALSLAFFNQHLASVIPTAPELTADYAAYLSQAPFDLWLISQASSQLLKQKLQALDLSLIAEIMEFTSETQASTLEQSPSDAMGEADVPFPG